MAFDAIFFESRKEPVVEAFCGIHKVRQLCSDNKAYEYSRDVTYDACRVRYLVGRKSHVIQRMSDEVLNLIWLDCGVGGAKVIYLEKRYIGCFQIKRVDDLESHHHSVPNWV